MKRKDGHVTLGVTVFCTVSAILLLYAGQVALGFPLL